MPVHNLITTLRLPDGSVCGKCMTVSDGKDLDFQIDGDDITIELANLETMEMIELSNR